MSEVPDLSNLIENPEIPDEVRKRIEAATEAPPPSPFADGPVPGGKIQVVTEVATVFYDDAYDATTSTRGSGLGSLGYTPLGVYISPADGTAILIPYDKVRSIVFDFDETDKLIEAENAKVVAEAEKQKDGESSSD